MIGWNKVTRKQCSVIQATEEESYAWFQIGKYHYESDMRKALMPLTIPAVHSRKEDLYNAKVARVPLHQLENSVIVSFLEME